MNWNVPDGAVVRCIHDRFRNEVDGTDVLATVVDVEGTAYRRPGAKMLLTDAGDGVGSITAGCFEDELRQKANEVREAGRSRLVTFDLLDDEGAWGLGVGCNGVVDVLLEPLDDGYRQATEAIEGGQDVAVLTALGDAGPLSWGNRAYYVPDEDRFEAVGGDVSAWPTDELAPPAGELAEQGSASVVELDVGRDRRIEVFVDGLAAPVDLVIFGSGRDVGPVTELAKLHDFRVTVVGFRGAVNLEERFPDADRTVTTSPATVREVINVDDRTYAVVMSHNLVDDRLTVDELLGSPAPYVGLLGPRERFEEMLAVFEAEGRRFEDGDLDVLYSPIGLDLGSGSPYGIAHSIVAEVLTVANDREPRHLRSRAGPIHDRIDVTLARSSTEVIGKRSSTDGTGERLSRKRTDESES